MARDGITLVELTKGGGTTVTNGTVGVSTNNDAWSVTGNYQGNPNRYWINYDGTDPNAYTHFGIALTGSFGTSILPIGTGLCANISIEAEGTWYSIYAPSMLPVIGAPPNKQSYLDGEKTNSTLVNDTNDAMVTFIYYGWFNGNFDNDMFSEFFRQAGGFGIQINANTRDMTLAIIAVKEPTDVPEPATLAIIGLGLTCLGWARRRK